MITSYSHKIKYLKNITKNMTNNKCKHRLELYHTLNQRLRTFGL